MIVLRPNSKLSENMFDINIVFFSFQDVHMWVVVNFYFKLLHEWIGSRLVEGICVASHLGTRHENPLQIEKVTIDDGTTSFQVVV